MAAGVAAAKHTAPPEERPSGHVPLAERPRRPEPIAVSECDTPVFADTAIPDGGWASIAEQSATATPNSRLLHFTHSHLIQPVGEAFRRLLDHKAKDILLALARTHLHRITAPFRLPDSQAHPAHPTGSAAPQLQLRPEMGEFEAPILVDEDAILAKVKAALDRMPSRGKPEIPSNTRALARLLADPPPTADFEATDLLHDCFSRGTRNCANPVLLFVARNLTRNFGRPAHLPIASGKAWTMLDSVLFANDMAEQLNQICKFIQSWQSEQKTFLILDFGEIELIEYLFESLHPRHHGGLLVRVMEFKVLSSRRLGLLRRIPNRVRRIAQQTGPDTALAYANDTLHLLEIIAREVGFKAVIEAAEAARTEVEKIAAPLKAAPSPPPPPRPTLASAPPPPTGTVPQPASPQGVAIGSILSVEQVMRKLGQQAQTSPPAAEPPPPNLPQRPPVTPPPPELRRQRFTKQQKTEAVLRVLRGEEPDWVAISLGIDTDRLAAWQATFLSGGSAAIDAKGQEPKRRRAPHKASASHTDLSIEDLKGKLHALIETVEVLSKQAQASTTPPPPKPKRTPRKKT
ncbi:Alanine and proline-rich secreted protein apa [Candidatus Terasakiella magnetica]|nr:Alanine and proline-rich secreted protein apa [Candidatus Terasakiella magnetica]